MLTKRKIFTIGMKTSLATETIQNQSQIADFNTIPLAGNNQGSIFMSSNVVQEIRSKH